MQFVIEVPNAQIIVDGAQYNGTEDFSVTLAASVTAAMNPNPRPYPACLVYTNPTEDPPWRHTSRQQPLYVEPNPLVTPNLTWQEQALVNIQAGIQALGATTNASVSVNGQVFSKVDLAKYWQQHDRLVAEVGRIKRNRGEKGAEVRGGAKTIVTRFRG